MLTDSHAHLDYEGYEGGVEGAVARARAAGVGRIVLIGLWRKPGDFGNALELAARDPAYFAATVGVHPHDVAKIPEEDWQVIERASRDPRVVGVGETGLDFHYDHSPRPQQVEGFRRSIAIAKAAHKPVVVHVREADEACAEVIRSEGAFPDGGVIHCFTGDWARAKAYLDLGFHISIAGVVTFKSADDLRDAARRVPRDRLLVETDSPYLAPVPYRGRKNEPAYVAKTAELLAQLQGCSLDELADATSANARRLFRLPG